MMDVRYAEEVRDDLLVSMAWLDERRGDLVINWKRIFMLLFRSCKIDRIRLRPIIPDTAPVDCVVSLLSFAIASNLTSSL